MVNLSAYASEPEVAALNAEAPDGLCEVGGILEEGLVGGGLAAEEVGATSVEDFVSEGGLAHHLDAGDVILDRRGLPLEVGHALPFLEVVERYRAGVIADDD
jgi:hypothetical protein